MANTAQAPADAGPGPAWRDRVLREPGTVLDDPALMRALVDAGEARRGGNVVDLRGLAMRRLEVRLDRLEDAHRTVVANAYDNLSGTVQIHRCVLALLSCRDLGELLDALATDVARILRVAFVRLAVEGDGADGSPHPALACLPAGAVRDLTGAGADGRVPPVVLRAGAPGVSSGSEALLTLDLGPGRTPALLVLGAADPGTFRPGQATDLLAFLGGCTGRLLRRMLGA